MRDGEPLRKALRMAAVVAENGGTGRALVIVPYSCLESEGPEAVRAGFDVVLRAPRPDLGLEELRRSGILAYLPEVGAMVGFGGLAQGHKDLWEHTKTVVRQADPDLTVRWCALFHDVGKVPTFRRGAGGVSFHGHEAWSARMFRKAADRTRMFDASFVGTACRVLENLGRVEAYEPEWTDSAIRRLMVELGPTLGLAIRLSRADITTGNGARRESILRSLAEFEARVRSIAEQDALPPALPRGLGTALCAEWGLTPSRELGDVMARIRDAVPRGLALEEVLAAVRADPARFGLTSR